MSSKIIIKKKRIYKEEDGGIPANHTGAGVANWNPLLGGPKIRKRHVELDGRTKQYRSVVKRIKTRNAKSQERAIKKKFAMWGVTTNPFVKENTIMDESKYLKTKTGSIEDAVITSVNTSPNENPHNTRPLLHLPKKKYLESKENSLEQMAINALAEKTDKVNPKELKGKLKDREDADIDNDGDVDQSDRFLHKRRKAIHKKSNEAYNPDTHTSVGSKQKIKPQFNTKTHKLITLPNGNVKVVPKSTPGMEAEEVEETNLLIQATIDELSKKTLGSYVKKAASSSTDAGMALQRSTDKPGGQTRGDVDKHVGTLTKRRKGIATAADKLSKEDVELDEIGFAQAGKIASAQAIARGRAKEKEADDRELALKKKVSITQKGLDALRRDRDRPKVKTQVKITKKGRDAIRDEVEVDEGNVKGKGEWMPWAGKHATGETKKKKQNVRDRDNEAQGTRSKTRPTAEEVEVDENRSPTLVTTRTVLKPSLKGMSKKAKAILRFKDNQAKRIQNKDNRAPGEDLIK